MDTNVFLNIAYLVASVLFILGLRGMNHPESAKRGMVMAMVGMAVAIIGTMFVPSVLNGSYNWIIIGIVVGSIFGGLIALLTPMTKMPERTAFSHACGALAVTLVGLAKFYQHGAHGQFHGVESFAVNFEVLFGALTVTGSIIAMGKLQGFVTSTPVTFKGQNIFNLTLFGAILVMFVYLVAFDSSNQVVFYTMAGLSLLVGVMLVIPIGAADMPVVISLLNSYAGLACCATGFALGNNVLIIGGALDGASGFILSIIMCKAMNRSITNVLFGAFGQIVESAAGKGEKVTHIEMKIDEAAEYLRNIRSAVIVPGYGLAVSQAQHIVRELGELLEENGCDVKYAIHPVAGRMPGHMNVLLAEANVPYDQLVEMEHINSELPNTDACLVIGANDVVNTAAREDRSSPLWGMPIIDVDKSKLCMVLKRSMRPGFAGVENPLFYKPNTRMVFGDAKAVLQGMVNEIKNNA